METLKVFAADHDLLAMDQYKFRDFSLDRRMAKFYYSPYLYDIWSTLWLFIYWSMKCMYVEESDLDSDLNSKC